MKKVFSVIAIVLVFVVLVCCGCAKTEHYSATPVVDANGVFVGNKIVKVKVERNLVISEIEGIQAELPDGAIYGVNKSRADPDAEAIGTTGEAIGDVITSGAAAAVGL